MEDFGKKQIGDYELLAIIGDGAQGRVYKASVLCDTVAGLSKGMLVALKVVNIAGEDENMRRKFQQQSDILRRLSHDSIVKYIDSFVWRAGELDECQCLVMEYLEGEDLTARIKNFPSGLGWPQVEEIFEKCLAGLIHARECGITHRDLKPSNIYLTKDGNVKLIDFDIAKKDDSEQLSTAGWKGTFDYMAPDFITQEGFRGDEISDVFSLGVCFYQALTGSLPYEPLGSNAHIGYVNRWHGCTSKPPSFRVGIFRVLAGAKEFVDKAIAVQRGQRYQSFTEMLEDFRKIHSRVVRHKGKEDYELLALLGRGGFGEVFKARCASDGKLVAVKHLFSEKQSDRFIKEAKILQRYNHDNLVRYVDFMSQETNTGNKQFFLVMEYLEGMPGWTLRLRIKNEGRLGVDETLKLFKVYLDALHFMHSHAHPIIHRDIKPGNLYAPVGRPEKGKIFDMGVARDVSGTVTTGGIPGTLDYMAPEFADASGDRGSPQSDIYALGLCFYESLTGNPVYERLPQDINSAWSGFIGRVKSPPTIAFDDPLFAAYPRLIGIVVKSLALNPADRYASAQAMIDDLDQALLPLAQGTADDDLFGDAELTMATSPDGGGVTLGTRPMDGDINDYLKKIKATEKKPEGRKRLSRSTLALRLSIAALGVIVAGGALWLGVAVITGKGKKTIGGEPQTVVAALDENAVKTPELPPVKTPEAPPNKEPEKVAVVVPSITPTVKPQPQPKNPATVEPAKPLLVEPPPKPVVATAANDPDAQVILGLISDRAESATDVKALEEQVASYQKLVAMPEATLDKAQRAQFEKVAAARYKALAEDQYLAFKKACDSNDLPRASAIENEFLRWAAMVAPEFGREQLLEKAQAFASDYKQSEVRQAQNAAEKADVAKVPAPSTAVPHAPPVQIKEQPPAHETSTKSYLEISISPDKATLQVDGHNVAPGKIEVEPDKNHRIEVACPGYKSVKQFYKVSPGDTRKVDILLLKGQSKSIFGF